MNYEIRELHEGDLAYLSKNLRPADIKEIYASTGSLDILSVLRFSACRSTELLVGAGDDKPVMIMGMTPIGQSGVIWACATPDIRRYGRVLLTDHRPILKGWFEKHPQVDVLFNFTHADNLLHQAWLKRCGATLLPPVPKGPLGELFKPFTIRRDLYV